VRGHRDGGLMESRPNKEELAAFRLRARVWLAENAPRGGQASAGRRGSEDLWLEGRRFQSAQNAAGFSGITWPATYGGQGLTRGHQSVFNEEAEGYELPSNLFQITLAILGMTLLDHGTEEQKRRYLPEMLRGDALWVQLLSEPGAGSDLAAVRTQAVRDGDEWVLNGQKVWSSYAQWSDYSMVLARTDWDVPKHAGLTVFILPLDTKGVTIRPLKQISGEDEFCEEFLDDVRLPADAVLGAVNRGWSVTLSMFNHSRDMTGGAGGTGPTFDKSRGGDPDPGRELIDFAVGAGLAGDHHVRQLVAELVADNVVSGLLATRVSRRSRLPKANPAWGTMAKVFGAVTLQRRRQIELDVRGEATIGWRKEMEDGGSPLHDYLWARTATVAGGTHEVNNNTIGERILGLPTEPAVDRDRPFREVIRAAEMGGSTPDRDRA
jgi:alkylation response protein AidB-like acyl-CoA dehydrogenase